MGEGDRRQRAAIAGTNDKRAAVMVRLHPFEKRLAAEWPVANWQNLHVVLAVSGGADSMALLRAILGVKAASGGVGTVFVGHFDHGLRGDASHTDAEWLQRVCLHLGVPFEVGRGDVKTRAAEEGDGVEAAARAARYEFLLSTAERLGARFVVMAHTANDQAETVLHRIVRGTGLAGLAGIPAVRPLSKSVTLVRPLLSIDRAQVIEYLTAIGQDFREDGSNADPQHTRNRLRHEILPAIREMLNLDVDGALIRLAEQAAENQSVVEELAGNLSHECVRVEFDPPAASRGGASICARAVYLDCETLAEQRPIIIREVCRAAWNEANWPQKSMGFNEWQKLAQLVAGEIADSFNLPGSILAQRRGEVVILTNCGVHGLT